MNDPVLFERFEAWLEPSPSVEDVDRAEFFSNGTIILDTNVLLSLYEYTESSRVEVLSALELAKGRLWMPYQVGLEFVRGRRRTLKDRKRALSNASSELNKKMMAARQAIFEARKIVSDQVEKYSRAPREVAVLRELASEAAVDESLAPYRDEFKRCLNTLKKEHGLALDSADADAQDPILVQVAQLYGAAVGMQPDDDTLRKRVDYATEFRFPNKIPPGFGDLGKGTPISDAGDFLLWEEMIHYERYSGDLITLKIGQRPQSSKIVFLPENTTYRR
ncbi:PIN-like domain-containing protein, partial [Amycolatopsis sulphurea]